MYFLLEAPLFSIFPPLDFPAPRSSDWDKNAFDGEVMTRLLSQDIPLPYEFLINIELIGYLYPSFEQGLVPFFSFLGGEYSYFLVFERGLHL